MIDPSKEDKLICVISVERAIQLITEHYPMPYGHIKFQNLTLFYFYLLSRLLNLSDNAEETLMDSS